MTAEQIEQKTQLLEEKVARRKAISKELAEAGINKLSDDELERVTGGGYHWVWYDPGDGCEVAILVSDDPCSPDYYAHEVYAREYGG